MSEYRIGRLGDRFAVSWYGDDGKRRRYRLAALTRKDAESEALDRIRSEVVKTTGATVAALWEAYLSERKGRPIEVNMRSSGKPIGAKFGHLRPDQITTEDCRAYAKARAKAGIKPGSVWTELGHLRTCLGWAQKAGLIDRAPAIERPQKPAPRDNHLDRAEVARLLAADCAPHIRLAIILLLATAGRVSAVLGMTWDRVDFERGRIDLREDLTGPRKGRAVVPMNRMARAALQTAKEAALSPWVVEWAGERVGCIRRGFLTACKSAGLKNVQLHTLRHTAAVHMIESGVPIEMIAQYLGHSNPQITFSVYARYSPAFLEDASRALEYGKVGASRE